MPPYDPNNTRPVTMDELMNLLARGSYRSAPPQPLGRASLDINFDPVLEQRRRAAAVGHVSDDVGRELDRVADAAELAGETGTAVSGRSGYRRASGRDISLDGPGLVASPSPAAPPPTSVARPASTFEPGSTEDLVRRRAAAAYPDRGRTVPPDIL